jgi:hypothetical protein
MHISTLVEALHAWQKKPEDITVQYSYLGLQQATESAHNPIALNACGFWAAFTALYLLLDNPPEMIPRDIYMVKEIESLLLSEYRRGGITQKTFRERVGLIQPLPKTLDALVVSAKEVVSENLQWWMTWVTDIEHFDSGHITGITVILLLPPLKASETGPRMDPSWPNRFKPFKNLQMTTV